MRDLEGRAAWTISDSDLQETLKSKEPLEIKSESEAEVCKNTNRSTNQGEPVAVLRSWVWNWGKGAERKHQGI